MAPPPGSPRARYVASAGVTNTSGRATAWADQSGNGFDMAADAVGPIIDIDTFGRPILRFLNSEDCRLRATVGTSNVDDLTVYLIRHSGSRGIETLFGLQNAPSTAGYLRTAGADAEYFQFSRSFGIGRRGRISAELVGGVFAPGSTTQVTALDTTTAAGYTGTYDGWILGGKTNDGLNEFCCEALELLIYSTATAPTVAAVQAWAISEYGVPDGAQNIVFVGDSITRGTDATEVESWVAQTYRPSVASWMMTNLAVSGDEVSDAIGDAAIIDSQLRGGRDVLMVLLGRNDSTSVTDDAYYTSLVSFVQARVSAGWEVWVGTNAVLTDICDGQNDRIKGVIGSGIIADAGADRVIDFDSLTAFNDASAYQGDGTHPTVAGAKIMADYFAPNLEVVTAGPTVYIGANLASGLYLGASQVDAVAIGANQS